ncbi:hypothetical protein MKZ38_001835 [Zalerion maritima]|uniref:Uncharacterized protein n=1 Tax=Zalerion maritima TaxID=339359 RepID=A0AAD5RXA1_9PEZI|nr:hypothetical protein MKZ38_001835 [Zalerion maritima]
MSITTSHHPPRLLIMALAVMFLPRISASALPFSNPTLSAREDQQNMVFASETTAWGAGWVGIGIGVAVGVVGIGGIFWLIKKHLGNRRSLKKLQKAYQDGNAGIQGASPGAIGPGAAAPVGMMGGMGRMGVPSTQMPAPAMKWPASGK